nr:mycothiol conjugate amidase Mca [Raineyella antarctica]
MHVHAHPDDESSKGAATTARYEAEGVDVVVVTCTGGELGDVLNPAMDRPEIVENLPEVRRKEMDAARDILGIDQIWLGYADSGLPEGDPLPPLPEGSFATLDPAEAARPLVGIIRRLRPHVLTTYDENGGYPHPDHIQTHRVSMEAVRQAADARLYPELGPAWQVPKVYYQMTLSAGRWRGLNEAMRSRGLEAPYDERLTHRPVDEAYQARITTRVPCADYFEVRNRALLAHATQVDPNGMWFACPVEIEKEAWPTEDYELVINHTSSMPPEDDLFAGIAVEPR